MRASWHVRHGSWSSCRRAAVRWTMPRAGGRATAGASFLCLAGLWWSAGNRRLIDVADETLETNGCTTYHGRMFTGTMVQLYVYHS